MFMRIQPIEEVYSDHIVISQARWGKNMEIPKEHLGSLVVIL